MIPELTDTKNNRCISEQLQMDVIGGGINSKLITEAYMADTWDTLKITWKEREKGFTVSAFDVAAKRGTPKYNAILREMYAKAFGDIY